MQKTSPYNRLPFTYDGKHNAMGTDKFRDYISSKVQFAQKISQDKKIIQLASQKGCPVGEVVFAILEEQNRQEHRSESQES